MRRGSSRRFVRWPTSFGKTGEMAMRLPLVRGVLNCVDDVLVAGAAAEVPGEAFADLPFRGLRVVLQQRDGRHDHARRTVTALQAVFFPEALLQRMQVAVRREPLDRRDGGSVGLNREDGAR